MPTPRLTIGLVAHDRCKRDMVEWVRQHLPLLAPHRFIATGTTGRLLEETYPDLEITRLKSGPLGGDQQLGALIATDELDCLIFLVDPMTPQPHDVDVKALIRLCQLYEIPLACNLSSANLIISNPNFLEIAGAAKVKPEERFADYATRKIP